MPDASPSSSVGHLPAGERWAFDASVTEVFEDMLRRSIPQHDVMREAVAALAERYYQLGYDVLDLGCSRGEALDSVRRRNLPGGPRYVGLEVSPPMLAAAKERFKAEPSVLIEAWDLRQAAPLPPWTHPCVALSVFTLQFVPINHRARILRAVHQRLCAGGALVLCEKVLGADAELDAALVDLYHRQKAANGYSAEEIDRKALSLEGVLVPVTAAWNEELLRSAGFRHVDCFWRWMNFAGWVAVKEAP